MSQKKRNKPIKIALTEEQIANIINEAAKSRRGLNIESLEDRIAPSRFGLPVFGGAEAGLDGLPTDDGGIPTEGDPGNPFDPIEPPEAGADGSLPTDPNLPGEFDPNAANPDGSIGGPVFDPANPAPFDPASGGTPPWMQAPDGLDGGLDGGEPSWFGGDDGGLGGNTDPLAEPGLEGGDDGLGGNGDPLAEPEGDFLTTDYSQFPEGFPVDELPDDLKEMMQERLQAMQDNLQVLMENGEPLPDHIELDEHRVNILTQMLEEYGDGPAQNLDPLAEPNV